MARSFLIFLIFFLFGFFIWQGIYLAKEPKADNFVFSVKKGEGVKEISVNLKKEGLIKYSSFFRFYVLISGKTRKLQAGRYLLSPSMNIPEIVKKLSSGEIIKEKITIIEGWNLRDIAWYFENRGLFQAEEFFELVGFPLVDYSKEAKIQKPKDFSQEFSFLKDKPKNISLEGYLFPDTYEIKKGEALEIIVKKMLKNFDKKLTPDLKEEIIKQNKSIFEIVTMASLLEKEVKTYEDKRLVSGILWKRLKNRIPLQVDATITYITGKKTTKISKADTEIDSPYNTYKYLGLPPGPIANPGLESIKSALYPKSSDFWYYLSTPEGKTIFSKNLKEHNIAKTKYLK